MRSKLHHAIALTAALLASGCAVGPNFKRPAPPAVSRYTPEPLPPSTTGVDTAGGAAQRFADGQDIPGDWWTLFHSPALNALVAEALKANPDLEAAKAALRAARETYKAQRGAFFPEVDAGYNISRQRASGTLAPPLNSNNDLFTLHTAQVTVGYTLDVFGGVRRQVESARAQAEAQRFQTEAVYLTLTSNVVAAALQAAALRDQIDATRKTIEAARSATKILRRQMAAGQISGGDLALQETALAQAEQALPPLEKQLAQQRDLIADLTGRAPSETPTEQLDLATLTLPANLPVSLPARLVEQRPDIRAAEANLHSASALVGVAIAARLPSLTLSANAGGSATNISNLFSSGATFWSIGAGLAQPVFDGGALLHKQRAAQATLDQAKAQYRSTVLAALQNVADALQALDVDARALAAAAAADQAAARSLAITQRQLELGQVSGPALLAAQQAYQQTAVTLTQAQAARYADTAALFQALGGGWWNRDEKYGLK
jgi:NodT family efflux transporter outer membrane factor (OMF) lipoprotein